MMRLCGAVEQIYDFFRTLINAFVDVQPCVACESVRESMIHVDGSD